MDTDMLINTTRIGSEGRKLFETISKTLEKEHRGEVIAIDVDSDDYFIGKTGVDATEKARQKYPNKIFFLGRIGYPTYVSFKGRR